METSTSERTANLKKVELPNGETYAYREVGDYSKKTLLMIHGNASSSFWFEFAFPHLTDTFRIVVPDLRGYGYSTYNKPISVLEDFAEDVKLFCDKLDLKNFVLFGWSMGGGIAMKFAAKYPEYVEKLVLHNSLGPSGLVMYKMNSQFQFTTERIATREDVDTHPFVVGTLKKYADKNIDEQITRFITAIWNGKNVPEKERLKAFAEESMLQKCYADVIYAMGTQFNISDKNNGVIEGTKEIFNIKCKTLCFSGKKDLLCPFATSEEIKSYLGDLCELKIYEDSGHSAIEDHTEEVTSLIKGFVAN